MARNLQSSLIFSDPQASGSWLPMKVAQKVALVIQKIIHRILQWPSQIVHRVYLIGIIKNKREDGRIALIRAHSENLSPLEDEELLLANSLVERGFCKTNLESFTNFGSAKFQVAAENIYDLIEKNYHETGQNIDIVKLITLKPSLLDQFKTIFRAGLDVKLLRIIENYLRLPVAYGGVDIFFTVADGLERGARTWHKDSEDNPMVKVAIYLNDVGDDDGPLEALHLEHTSSAISNLKGLRQKNLLDLQKEGKLQFEVISFTGPRGTMILCDTFRYFHRGKPAIGKNRKALFFNYYANKPLTPYFCPNPPFSVNDMKDLVSDLSVKQRNSALWRESLTGIDRIVTKRKPYLNL